jgi:hypothetical protein
MDTNRITSIDVINNAIIVALICRSTCMKAGL